MNMGAPADTRTTDLGEDGALTDTFSCHDEVDRVVGIHGYPSSWMNKDHGIAVASNCVSRVSDDAWGRGSDIPPNIPRNIDR